MKHLLIALVLLVGACRPADAAPKAKETKAAKDPRSLYERLGGLPAIEAVVGAFVARTTTDPRIKERFFNTDAEKLKRSLADFVCAATGGPCTYGGRDMHEAHAGMELVDAEFDALVEDLVAALDQFKVGAREKGELLGALGPMRPMMVARPDTLHPIERARLDTVTALAATLTDPAARELLQAAVVAGERGQRNYAEQLFTRAELAIGGEKVAAVAEVFRAGAPPRVDAPPVTAPAAAEAQPAVAGSSDDGVPPPRKPRASLSGSVTANGAALDGFGVVMLTPDRGGKKKVPRRGVIEQRGKVFAPRLAAVPVGSTVTFPNYDSVFHNVFSLSKTQAFDLGMYKQGLQREVTFDKPGIVRLGCNIHASMSAYVVVVDAPHYVVVGADGTFNFRSLKPGKYTVKVWTERSAEPVVSRLEIKPGANQQTLDVAGGPPSGPSPDKFGTARAAPAAHGAAAATLP